jgi:hypothetical protein
MVRGWWFDLSRLVDIVKNSFIQYPFTQQKIPIDTVITNSQTRHSIYILHIMSFTLRLCQYTTCFGSAKPSSGTCINVKTQVLNQIT